MKLTINLEQALLKENAKSILTTMDLLQIKQYETIGKIEGNNVFSRLGLDENIRRGNLIKIDSENKLKDIKKFDPKRVFHISQIEKTCNKYLLKFLPIRYFKGELDVELPQKVVNFELIYGIEVSKFNSFIIAPSESFKLEEYPEDPLFFYQINDEYYYLIHKWGNDLNITNRFYSILYNYARTILTAIVSLIVLYFEINIGTVLLLIIYALIVVPTSIGDLGEDQKRKTTWSSFVYDSPYLD